MSKEWPLWEVFIRSQHGLAHKHVGSLHAPDAELAIKNARDVYTRRNEGVSIWVVRSADLVASSPGDKEALFDPANSKVYISTYGGLQTTSGSINGFSMIDIALFLDGAIVPNGAYQRVTAPNNSGVTGVFEYWSFSTSTPVTAGSHTFSVRAAGVGIGSNATVGGNNSSVLQGELTVVFVKQ